MRTCKRMLTAILSAITASAIVSTPLYAGAESEVYLDEISLAEENPEPIPYTEWDFYGGDLSEIMTYSGIYPSSVDLSTSPCFPAAIANQGESNACAAFSTVYYQYSYEVNKLNGVASSANQTIYSPRWAYNILNGGDGSSGIGITNIYALLKSSGALKWDDLPFDETDVSSLPEGMEAEKLEALNTRLETFYSLSLPGEGTPITSPTDSDLNGIKTALNDGKMPVIATSVDFDTKNGYGEYSGTVACYRVIDDGSGHDMAVVGYDDNFCCDFNNNGTIEDSEKGAFKVVNSFGTESNKNYDNNGYVWVMYDALNAVSANTANEWESNLIGTRVPAFSLENQYPLFWLMDVAHKDVYLVGEIFVQTTKFDDLQIKYSRSTSDVVSFYDSYNFEPYFSNLRDAEIERAFNGVLLFDYGELCTPPEYYLSGNNWNTSARISSTDSNLRIIDNKGNELCGYDESNHIVTASDVNYCTVNTKIGDLDYDNTLTQNDAQLVQDSLAQTISLSALQKILADFDRNGSITINDAVLIVNSKEA